MREAWARGSPDKGAATPRRAGSDPTERARRLARKAARMAGAQRWVHMSLDDKKALIRDLHRIESLPAKQASPLRGVPAPRRAPRELREAVRGGHVEAVLRLASSRSAACGYSSLSSRSTLLFSAAQHGSASPSLRAPPARLQ